MSEPVCGPCETGEHGAACTGAIDDRGEDTCSCTDGACRGEWLAVGYLDATVHGDPVEQARADYLNNLATAGQPDPRMGIKDPVRFDQHGRRIITPEDVARACTELRESFIQAAPAIRDALTRVGYAAAEAVTRIREAASSATRDGSADNESYVRSRLAGSLHHTAQRRAELPSPTMDGLGKQQIIDHSLDAPGLRPGYVPIPEHLGGLPDDAPERHRDRPNRADRRRAARSSRR